MSKYRYQPLNTEREEIRLVTLLPGEFADGIEIEIFHKDNYHPYEALSYVWGSLADLVPIQVRHSDNGNLRGVQDASLYTDSSDPTSRRYTLSIPQNLATALRYLRKTDCDRILWIDAICINQENLGERSHEVTRMGNIYGIARQVIIWLGPEADDSSLALEFLRNVGEELAWEPSTPGVMRYRTTGSVTQLLWDNPTARNSKHREFTAALKLLGRSWFFRLWTYQEYHLAKSAVIIAGNDQVSIEEFAPGVVWLGAAVSHGRIPVVLGEQEYLGTVHSAAIIRPKVDFLALLGATKRCNCFDPRDRVYAKLNLCPGQLQSFIRPDYTSPIETVYKELFLASIRCLDVVELFGETVRNDASLLTGVSAPSWIPDLACPIAAFAGGQASGKSAHEVSYSESDESLHVSGVRICKVSEVKHPISIGATTPEIIEYCQNWEVDDILETTYIDGTPLTETFIKTITCGYIRENWSFRSFHPSPCEAWDEYLSWAREGPTKPSSLLTNMQRFLPGRAYFSTDHHHIGLCPARTEPGDWICVALGCPNPLVLRPVQERHGFFTIQGECYIPGLMRSKELLGPLPQNDSDNCQWTTQSGSVLRELRVVYSNGVLSTQRDPRLDPLPERWQILFHADGESCDGEYEYNRAGRMRTMLFERIEDGFKTSLDPRLTSKALKERGVNIEELIII